MYAELLTVVIRPARGPSNVTAYTYLVLSSLTIPWVRAIIIYRLIAFLYATSSRPALQLILPSLSPVITNVVGESL